MADAMPLSRRQTAMIAGITVRQLDHMISLGVIKGSFGSERHRFSVSDARVICVSSHFLRMKIPPQYFRDAMIWLNDNLPKALNSAKQKQRDLWFYIKNPADTKSSFSLSTSTNIDTDLTDLIAVNVSKILRNAVSLI
jgi:hypothetical protein